MRSTLFLLAALLSASCATTGNDAATARRTPVPIATNGSETTRFSALGATYAVPAHWKIPDHERAPGIAWIDFVDQFNGCKGSVVWRATTDADLARSTTKENIERDSAGYQKEGTNVSVEPKSLRSLNTEWSAATLQLKNATDTAAKSYLALFLPDKKLVLLVDVFCDDPGFMEDSLGLVAKLADSLT